MNITQLGKPRKCKKCGVITKEYNRFTHTWSNGMFELNDGTRKILKLTLCFPCTNKWGEWLAGK